MILLTSSFNSFIQLLGVLLIFIFVLAITYFTTKWIGGFQKIQMAGKSLQVIETVKIAGNKYVQVIKTGEVYLVIAVGKDTVTMLAKLTEDEFGSALEQLSEAAQKGNSQNVQENFQDVLDKFKGHFSKKQD